MQTILIRIIFFRAEQEDCHFSSSSEDEDDEEEESVEDKVNTGLEQLEMGAAEARRLHGETSRRIAEDILILEKHYLMPRRDSNIHLPLLGGRSSPWTMWDSPSCPARYITTNTVTIITQCYVLILSQVHRRALAQGFQFNLLVLGEAGLGKSSLVNSMLWCEVWSWKHTFNKVFTATESRSVF